jgi:predicted nuclease of predicted toxin-antitoxin system
LHLYVDEDTASLQLVSRLRAAGHIVIEPLRGTSDARCWRHAQAEHAVLLTMNARDFAALAATGPNHGLLLVYRENDPTRDMTAKDIAAAVDRVAETYPEGVSDQILALNGFRW